ncbi:MAG: AAA family ATPase [Chitinophagales bacterium]|nr:AAA family ATPase [Chitinophagales bacterium]
MFTTFKISNFRTHIDTELKIQDITLIIGSNNSGKSNLLAALRCFSKLVSKTFFDSDRDKTVNKSYYFGNKHSLSDNDKPIIFACEWQQNNTKINYQLELYCLNKEEEVYCKERLTINENKYENGFTNLSNELLLRTIIQEQEQNKQTATFIDNFFRSLASIYYYNFQPSSLKGQVKRTSKRIFHETIRGKHLNIANDIGRDGSNFQELIKYVKEEENETYNKFLGLLQEFESSFVGILIDKDGQTRWQFNMGNNNFPYYAADKISDGLMKAAAVALLCAMKHPPAIIMIEEIENGINQKNLAKFLHWLTDTPNGSNKTQFIITSHSPSVIREFADRIDCVYNVHLKKKKGYVSEITNLNDAIKPLVRFGAIKEEEVNEQNGIYHISPHALTEMFYNGVLAEL